MVKYNIHENGWTVILEDFDFNREAKVVEKLEIQPGGMVLDFE